MNHHEREMLEILKKGREAYGFVSLKAEFEAEGTRMEELYRLVDLARRAGLKLALKIGGCEAVSDLFTARQLGADYIIAPMVETGYAASKYVDSKNKVYPPDERADTTFLFNLETRTGFDNRQDLAKAARVQNGVDGIVFGRVDFAGSLAIGRNAIGSDEVTSSVVQVAELCRDNDLELVVGGGVAVETLPALTLIAQTYLTRFETRKVVFDAKVLQNGDSSIGLSHAVHFELLWLRSKRDYYSRIAIEDAKRLDMLEERWEVLSRELEAA